MNSGGPNEITFLFTDFEGSTRLWEQSMPVLIINA